MKTSLIFAFLGLSLSLNSVVHSQEAASSLNATTEATHTEEDTKDSAEPALKDSESVNRESDTLASDGKEKSNTDAGNVTTENLGDNATDATVTDAERETQPDTKKEEPPIQSGPFIDLFGPTLLSLQMVNESRAQLKPHYTNEALEGKKVVGLYFSADWCGPCRKFTPDLVSFYNRINARRGKTNQFEIVWISRCRDYNSFGNYFTNMNWLALPPDLAMGQHGQALSEKYKVQGIPSLVLLDEIGNVITTDARNKIPNDKTGIGFPWRSPIATLYMTVLPRSLRMIIRSRVVTMKEKLVGTIKGMRKSKATA